MNYPNHEHTFAEEQEPSGRLIVIPCLECGMPAFEAMKQSKDELAKSQSEGVAVRKVAIELLDRLDVDNLTTQTVHREAKRVLDNANAGQHLLDELARLRERSINGLAGQIYGNAKAKGFHEYTPEFGKGGQDARHLLSWMMLITTEVAEAAEEIRVGNKTAFAEELADIVIRVLDCAATLDINLEQEVVQKMEKNKARPIKHGGKLA